MRRKMLSLVAIFLIMIFLSDVIAAPLVIPVEAIKTNDPSEVRKAIDEGADVNAKDEDGITALMWAAYCNSVEAAKLLIEKGADVNAKDKFGTTALYAAAGTTNSLDMIKLLIEKGADVNIKDKNGTTPLIVAAFADFLEAAKLLIEKGADVNAKDINGLTALQYAEEMGSSSEMITLLKKHGARE